jgi:hypothetical protein
MIFNLLNLGARIDTFINHDFTSHIMLSHFTRLKDETIILLLLAKNVNSQLSKGVNALFLIAVAQNNLSLTKLFLGHGARLNY